MTARRARLAPVVTLTVLLVVTLVLTSQAAGTGVLAGDVAAARWLQAVPVVGVETLAWFAFWAGSAPVIFIIAGLMATLFWRRGHTRLVVILIGILLLRMLNPWLKTLIASPRPSTEQVMVTEFAPEYGFPSGHTMGATLLYGGAIWFAERTIDRIWLRRVVQMAAVLVILITGFGRVHTGAHWPSDVLGGFLWGFTGLVLLLSIAGQFFSPRWPGHLRQTRIQDPVTLGEDNSPAGNSSASRSVASEYRRESATVRAATGAHR